MLVACVGLAGAETGATDYYDQGSWGGSCQTGSQQSPIDIDYAHTTIHYSSSFPDLGDPREVSYDGSKYSMVDDTAIIYMPDNWPVGHSYGLQPLQFHLHWGEDSTHGAEHHLFGDAHAAEVHLVMRNLDQNDPDSDDYYSVFGVFLDEVEDDSDELDDDIVTMMDGIVESVNDYDSITSFPLATLYSAANEVIYTYEGSLTTPECDEHVFWHVFDASIKVPTSTMATLRSTTSTKTNRDTQELGDREITQRLLGQRFDDSEYDEQTNDSSNNPEEEEEESYEDPDADGCEYIEDWNMYKCWYDSGAATHYATLAAVVAGVALIVA